MAGGPAIRGAGPGDSAAVRRILVAAFPTPVEAGLVERLAADGDVFASLVAEADGMLAGHVLLSRMRAAGDGRDCRALGLAPVAVLPARQREGIGSALVRAALAKAKAAGEERVFVLGDPSSYRRFGFDRATAAPFASPYAGPHFMAVALTDVSWPRRGRTDYAPAFAGLEEGK